MGFSQKEGLFLNSQLWAIPDQLLSKRQVLTQVLNETCELDGTCMQINALKSLISKVWNERMKVEATDYEKITGHTILVEKNP